VLDYIRIVGISDVCALPPNSFQVTYTIEHSQDSNFHNPKRGVFTINLSDLIDIGSLDGGDVENLAACLNGHVLMRGKEEDGTISILHLLGLPLGDWLMKKRSLLD
jgi:hypothetical protein